MATSLQKLCFIIFLALSLLRDSGALECHCSGSTNRDSCTIAEGACFVSTDLSSSDAPAIMGCLPKSLISLMCDQSDSSFRCCYGNYCNAVKDGNRFLRNVVTNNSTTGTSMDDPTNRNMAIAIAICIVGMTIFISLLAAAVCCVLYRRKQKKLRRQEDGVEDLSSPEVRYTTHSLGSFGGPDHCLAILPQSESIGSLLKAAMFYGNPLSLLVQRSITQRTALEKSLHKGTFCHHYIGKWRNDRVGVKVYTVKHEQMWFNETQISQLPLMRHENILNFIAADIVYKHSQNYHYLINEHHPRGTLRDYLTKSTIEVSAVLTLVTSLVSGLEYIHSSQVRQQSSQISQAGTLSKPAIAHRNVSSQNVYVDKSGACVWGDFSLAVKKEDNTQQIRFFPHGDVRYLPPEFLSDAPPSQVEFEDLRRGDMYALGLILWEITHCCLIEGENEEYSLPYFDLLDFEDDAMPTKEIMRRIVCVDKKRPHPPTHCTRVQNTRVIIRAMQECWCETPSERPSSQELKNSLEHSLVSVTRCHMTVDKNGQPVYKQTL